eukprot:scaffold21993_cov82-Cylindrotheca_fusiformis.AAC.2
MESPEIQIIYYSVVEDALPTRPAQVLSKASDVEMRTRCDIITACNVAKSNRAEPREHLRRALAQNLWGLAPKNHGVWRQFNSCRYSYILLKKQYIPERSLRDPQLAQQERSVSKMECSFGYNLWN